MSNTWKIDTTVLPSPTSVNPEINDLYGEETGRDEAGYNHLDLVRAGVRKWSLRFEMITRQELETIKSALDPLGFSFTGFDGTGWVTVDSCYGKLTGQELAFYTDDETDESRWNCSLSIIEN